MARRRYFTARDIAKWNHVWKPGRKMTFDQARAIAEFTGLARNGAEGVQAAQIGKGESGLTANILAPRPDDRGMGWLQNTPYAHGRANWGPAALRKWRQLGGQRGMMNPVKNAEMAAFLKKSAGGSWSPWYGTRYLNRNLRHAPTALARGQRGRPLRGGDGGPGTRGYLITKGVSAPKISEGIAKFDADKALMDLLRGHGKVTGSITGGRKRSSLLTQYLAKKQDPAYYVAGDPKVTPGKVETRRVTIQGGPGRGRQRGRPAGRAAGARGGLHAGGGWGGSRGIANYGIGVARDFGIKPSSLKRATQLTASGNTSDHYIGNKTAFAEDLPATGARGTKLAYAVARRYGIKNFRPGNFNHYYVTARNGQRYRIQILWQVKDHYDHVHVGVRRA